MTGPILADAMSTLLMVVAGVCLYRSLHPPPHLDNADRIIEGIFAIAFIVLAYYLAAASRP